MLGDKTCQLLWDVGMKVESEAIAAAMLARGCRQAPSGRICVPRQLIEEMTASQRPTQDADQRDQELHYYCGVDWAHHVIWHKKQEDIRRALKTRLLMSAFDCGPTTYYDYQSQRSVPVDTTIFIEMMKFAQATPEIGYISTWYRQDVPQAIERIDSLILGLKHTDKVDGIEAIDPAVIKYLKEISEIVTRAARRLQLSGRLRVHHLAADSREAVGRGHRGAQAVRNPPLSRGQHADDRHLDADDHRRVGGDDGGRDSGRDGSLLRVRSGVRP